MMTTDTAITLGTLMTILHQIDAIEMKIHHKSRGENTGTRTRVILIGRKNHLYLLLAGWAAQSLSNTVIKKFTVDF